MHQPPNFVNDFIIYNTNYTCEWKQETREKSKVSLPTNTKFIMEMIDQIDTKLPTPH